MEIYIINKLSVFFTDSETISCVNNMSLTFLHLGVKERPRSKQSNNKTVHPRFPLQISETITKMNSALRNTSKYFTIFYFKCCNLLFNIHFKSLNSLC